MCTLSDQTLQKVSLKMRPLPCVLIKLYNVDKHDTPSRSCVQDAQEIDEKVNCWKDSLVGVDHKAMSQLKYSITKEGKQLS